MKIQIEKGLMLLRKSIMFLAITLFSVLVFNKNANAASFKYSDFNWEEFLTLRNEFWTTQCQGVKDIKKCKETILDSQEEFYTKMYKLLAKYEDKKNLFISDAVIVGTIFVNLKPNDISSTGDQYEYDYGTRTNYFQIGSTEITDADVEDDENTLSKYFEQETDTLQLLIKNAIAYKSTCYGVLGDATKVTVEDGSYQYICDAELLQKYGIEDPDQLYPSEFEGKMLCVINEGTYSLSEFEYLVGKFYTKSGLEFMNKKDENYANCQLRTEKYDKNFIYEYSESPEVDYDKYFDYLYNNNYFDGKAHLQEYFDYEVLQPSGAKCMTKELCGDKSLESMGLYDKYYDKILKARLKIISRIIDALNKTGTEIYYNANTSDYKLNGSQRSIRKSFYWPIGSTNIEEKDGIKYAIEDPESTEISSYFGTRNSVTGEVETHYGIDIKGEKTTNVIAAYYGEVIEVVDSCEEGDYTCNGGLGNSITISHANGDYTIYGGLSSIESKVQPGVVIKQGEVIGKVGATGNKSTTSLHFEIRVGGNDVSYSINPLNYISATNPRPKGSAKDFSIHETSLTKEEFVSKLKIYCTNTKCSNGLQSVMVNNAELVYDESIKNNINPEFVVVRAISEGFSPGTVYYNYWGIGCTNGASASQCNKYSSLADGIRGLASLSIVRNNETASGLMLKYAYIGKYWFNLGGNKIDWGLGGCPYFPYIAEYMSEERSTQVSGFCKKLCYKDGSGDCEKTNDEDQLAYATWQVEKKMGKDRHNIFGL